MATGHHHQCHCHSTLQPPPPPTTTCYCTTCSTTTTHYSPQPPPPPPPQFHSISPHLHHHNHAPPQSHLHAPPQNHHHHHHDHKKHQLFQKYCSQEDDDAEEENSPVDPTVSSLIRRIAALESSLRRHSSSSKGSQRRTSALRDAAARTIQIHFRAFLVRRSVTLRNLKDLAYIKSSLNSLKSSISDEISFDSRLLSRESMNLLIKLDSIKGSDPMIRDGKRSISRELIRFMEFIDEMSTENHVISVKNVRVSKNGKKSVILQREQKIRASGSRVLSGGDDDVRKSPQSSNNQSKTKVRVSSIPKLEEAIEKLELEKLELENLRKNGVSQNRFGGLMKNQPNAKKTVRFSENGNVYRLIKSRHGHGDSEGSDSSNGGEEEVEEVEEVEEIGVSSKETEVEDEDEDSSEMSENEMDPRKNLGTRMNQSTKNHQSDQEHNEEEDDDEDEGEDDFVFSAPLPEKMEYRVDSSKKMIGKQ